MNKDSLESGLNTEIYFSQFLFFNFFFFFGHPRIKIFNLSIFNSRKTGIPAMEQSLNSKFMSLNILNSLKISKH